ncbi:MAG: hypothetical protein E6P95_04270, partial [Candidatus Moraniibacteriota bacterium]
MSIGERISRGIGDQVGNQPESWKNAASRWVDRKFGQLDSKISLFLGGQDPETPQQRMDLADTIARTPNYLLESAIHAKQGKDESRAEAGTRVAGEVKRLFEAISLSQSSHSEDVRSEKAIALSEKPQKLFDHLLQNSLKLDEGKVVEQLRLSAALMDSGVVGDHNLIVDETEDGRQEKVLEKMVKSNMEHKFLSKVSHTMAQYADSYKADFGIRRCGSLKRAASEVFGDDFEMPEKVVREVRNQIAPTIEATMSS